MPFAWLMALRFLREGRAQTALVIGGVAVGVGVIVFLSALIGGLQTSLIRQTLGTQAHIVVRQPDEAARPLMQEPVLRQIDEPPQRLRGVPSWPAVASYVETVPGVVAVSPLLSGPAFAARGNASRAVALRGIEPAAFGRIIALRERLVSGTDQISGSEVLIGAELARELGVSLGDKIRVGAAEGTSVAVTVQGVFDLQNKEVNSRWLLAPLRTAQSLLGMPGEVTSLEVRVADVFASEAAARAIAAHTGLAAESWTELNKQLLVALRSQSSSSILIQLFVIIAVALGIASVLVVSVVQKSREIGILKAMGATRQRVTRVFLLQGAIVGLAGSLLGSLVGAGLALSFAGFVRNPDGSPLFPMDLSYELFLRTSLIALATGILAAVTPARRAARLDPATVIRYG